MATYYVDPDASGANDGTSWTDAWEDFQDALDNATAGDTVYCRGTQTLTAKMDVDTNSGSTTGGLIKFIGCNASGNVDGTRFVLDGDNAVAYCIDFSTKYYQWFENIECKNATSDGFYKSSYGGRVTLVNCCSNNNGRHGFNALASFKLIRCVAYSNTNTGFYRCGDDTVFLFCRSRDNGDDGFDLYACASTLIGCIADHNGADGFADLYDFGVVLFNCVADDNTANGIVVHTSSTLPLVVGSRITNHDGAGDIGFDGNSRSFIEGWNYLQNNDGDNFQNATYKYNIPDDGSSTTSEDQGDTESGYTDEDDPEDYNLVSGATLRRTAISIPTS